MTPENWALAQKLFEQGLEHNAQEREQMLASSCGGQEEIAALVRNLWADATAAETFLKTALVQPAAGRLDSPERLATGQELGGRFTVLELIGAGGMSEVYQARDERLGRIVALKVLPARLATEPALRQRLEIEARAVSMLAHPAICALYDVGIENDVPFLVMEYLTGETLDQRISRGAMAPGEVVEIARQLLEGLDYAHAHGIVHRDLKPSNIMLTAHGAKLLDFGIAKRAGAVDLALATSLDMAGGDVTRLGEVVGTLAYMSPEQAQGREIDHRSDIFSFGCVLFEMATGERAFGVKTALSTLTATAADEAAILPELSIVSIPALGEVVQRCVRWAPEGRYQSATELKDAVVAALPQVTNAERKRTLWVMAGGAAAVLILVIGAMLWSGRVRAGAASRFDSPVRLTTEAGRAQDPAVSPDGRWVAFASDRSGNFDIYLQEVGSRTSRRLTDSPFDEFTPAFTPDGRYIVFDSDDRKAGISVVPLAGGHIRSLGVRGFRPRVSPDGKTILYSTGDWRETINDRSKVWAIPFAGGSPTRFFPDFYAAVNGMWSPDGKHILCVGVRTLDPSQPDSEPRFKWFVANADGSRPMELNTAGRVPPPNITGSIGPTFWRGDSVFAVAKVGDASAIFEVRFDLSKPSEPVRMTKVADSVQGIGDISASGSGLMAFSSVVENTDLYRIRVDRWTSKIVGPVERLTSEPSTEEFGSMSEDGRFLVYKSDRDGTRSLWIRDLSTGSDRKVEQLSLMHTTAAISPDGQSIAYQAGVGNMLLLQPTGGGSARTLVAARLQPLYWVDRETIAVVGPRVLPEPAVGFAIEEVNVNTGEKRVFPPDDCWSYIGPRVWACQDQQPDGTVTMRVKYGRTGEPFRLATEFLPETIYGAPDGGALYWVTKHNGRDALFAVRLDPRTAKPISDPFVVYEFRDRARMGHDLRQAQTMTNDTLILALTESTSNIWLQQLPTGNR